MLRDLSAQSDESASTTSSSSTNDISGLCYTTTRITTMNVERTYRWTRMLQSRVQFSSTTALPPTLFLADRIINIVESEFSIGTSNALRNLDSTSYKKISGHRNFGCI